MSAPVIILSHPQLGENIGAAARAMKNFGMSELRLVSPKAGWPNTKAQSMAVGASDLVNLARVYKQTPEALGDLNFVLATTARPRGITREVYTPEEGIRRLREAIARGERCGILFGNERSGLDNEEVSLADAVVTIPTTEFSSLNLGQAVLLLCHEWFRAGDLTPAVQTDRNPLHGAASREDLFHLFEHLESELTRTGFLYPPDKRDHMVRALRAMLHRAHLTHQEVQSMRGMIVALTKGKDRARPKKK